MINIIKQRARKDHLHIVRRLDILTYIDPGLLVTVGFIDPGNWASNFAAGSSFGYVLLWVVTLSTIMLIALQHNVAHLGIVTGLCLSEATAKYTPKWIGRPIIISAIMASISTSMAEILGGAIALQMLFCIPIIWGSILCTAAVLIMLFTNSYKRMERAIIGFVSMIGLSFIYELFLVKIDWSAAAHGWVVPSIPQGSLLVIASVLGAVVMPHNLFLHSEVIQSRQWNLENETIIARQLRFEFLDTLFSMCIGWAINSAMIIIAAVVFYTYHLQVTDLKQAVDMLRPILGNYAALLFAIALLLSGIASTTTACMAAGSIFAGLCAEPYDIADRHSRVGVILVLVLALFSIFLLKDPFQDLLY